MILEDGPEIQDEKTQRTIMEMRYRPVCPHKHRELNEHEYKHGDISKEGQEHQVQSWTRNSIDHGGNVRMNQDATSWPLRYA
jgi:hypothetical protein